MTAAGIELPALSANGAPFVDDFAVGASSEYAPYYAWQAFNRSNQGNELWNSALTESTAHIDLYFSKPVNIKKFVVTPYSLNQPHTPRAQTVFATKDRVTWQELLPRMEPDWSDFAGDAEYHYYYIDLSSIKEYFYGYRIQFEGQSYIAIWEIEPLNVTRQLK